MIFAWIFIGLALLIGGLLLYKRKQDRKPAHTSLRCVERMRFVLTSREEHTDRRT